MSTWIAELREAGPIVGRKEGKNRFSTAFLIRVSKPLLRPHISCFAAQRSQAYAH
ncbi:MAG: hypothetical protein ABI150_13620 [Nitrobacter sp.]